MSNVSNIEKLIVTKEVARLLNVAIVTVKKWRKNPKIKLKYYKVGGKVLYKLSEVMAFLDECKQ